MTFWSRESKAREYRRLAETVRAQAVTMPDAQARATMLETAGTWSRIADWEEKNPPPSDHH